MTACVLSGLERHGSTRVMLGTVRVGIRPWPPRGLALLAPWGVSGARPGLGTRHSVVGWVVSLCNCSRSLVGSRAGFGGVRIRRDRLGTSTAWGQVIGVFTGWGRSHSAP